METFKIVRPEHLNHYGYLFGGFMLQWVDEISWIAASRGYPECSFVTVAMDKVEFRRSVRLGALLRFVARQSQRGTTSVQYEISVFADDLETGKEEQVFSTHVTFVCLDDKGSKIPVPEHPGLRPTGDRVRETLFDWLQPVIATYIRREIESPTLLLVDHSASMSFDFWATSRAR